MKKFVGLMSVALLGFASVQAHGMMRERMSAIANELVGKSVTIPRALIEKLKNLCAEKLTVKAQMLRKMGEQFPKNRADYNKAAESLENSARAISELPITGDVKKTFDKSMMQQWLNLKAKETELKAELKDEFAEQLNSKKLAKKAKRLRRRARMLTEVAQELSQPKMMKAQPKMMEEESAECVSGDEYYQA